MTGSSRLVGRFLGGIFLLSVMSAPVGTAVEPAKGKRIYTELCQQCHGIDGRGSGAINLTPPPTDLTSSEVQGKLNAGLFKSIHEGRKNTAMGTWKYALSDEEIHEVIAYIRTLDGQRKATP